MNSSKSVDDYISSFPKSIQPKLNSLRECIKKAAPKSVESIKYGIPTFVMGRNLVHFGCYQNHIGFYPTPSGLVAFKKDLLPYKCSKGAVQFKMDESLPLPLITKIVKFRVKENMGKGEKK